MINKIGIIGGTGFVGRNLQERFDELDIDYEVASRQNGIDARKPEIVLEWIKRSKPDVVVNLAAECGGIGMNQRQPADLWLAATEISAGVLRACAEADIDRLVMLGTVCSYAADCPTPFSEDYLMNYGPPEPTNRAYGLAKLSGLYGAQAFEKQYGLSVCNLIAVNMYGPYDHFNLENSHVIPAIIKKIQAAIDSGDKSMTLWGTGSPTREFLYAQDFADAVLMSATKPGVSSDFINIGSGCEVSIKDLASMISDVMGYNGNITWDETKPDGQMRRCLNVDRARDMLGFMAKTELQDGLVRTIEWFRKNCREG
jgi:GDP-L-fucose synthase